MAAHPTTTTPGTPDVHPAWLPPEAFRPVGSRRSLVRGDASLVEAVLEELTRASAAFGGSARLASDGGKSTRTTGPANDGESDGDGDGESDGDGEGEGEGEGESTRTTGLANDSGGTGGAGERTDLLFTLSVGDELGSEGFTVARRDGVTEVLAEAPAGLLYGLFHVVRLGEAAFTADFPAQTHRPALRLRMLDHWDNIDVHPIMGQVERGYAGGSIFWRDGAARRDLARVRAYARLLAAAGVNAIAVNNVNVHTTEAHLLTDRLDEVAWIADVVRRYGIRVHLSVSFAAPVTLGGLATSDPLDPEVRSWWAETTRRVYQSIPDFGGYVVKADSEGEPGPFAYGRSHAEGANALADALAPFGGIVHWRAFVYNHRQDWRDRSTDRARAAYDHFAPLDGEFRDNAIVQVKYGPIDFQVREPVSPVIAAMPATRVAVELQVTQEYTGQQRHVCYLAPLWSQVLRFRPWGPESPAVWQVAAGQGPGTDPPAQPGADPAEGPAEGPAARPRDGGIAAVSNVGDDPFWTAHPLAQANLYAYGRLAWAPELDPAAILDEWIGLTFPRHTTTDPELLRRTLHEMMDDSWQTYEQYTAPLGVGFMVRPGGHYGPDVDGYEYTPWGTYHFADRDGVGVDRTRATGTGYTGQYPRPWSEVYESLADCPDELLLFFHHAPYGHVLRGGSTVIQHIYDTHFAGLARVAELPGLWQRVGGSVDERLHERVRMLLDEQVRCATEWRDQINTYFYRKSGVPDAQGRRIY